MFVFRNGGYAMLREVLGQFVATSSTRSNSPLIGLAVCVVLAVFLSGCAPERELDHLLRLDRRTVLDIKPPTSIVTNSTAIVKIADVKDQRVFEADPRNPSTPSLQTAADITNPMITVRAVARKRGAYGEALGDFVLPEGRTVAGLVRGALQKALQDKGYRVVQEGSPDYADAMPISVEIERFWEWITPGTFAFTIECQAAVTMTGAIFTSPNPAQVEGYAMSSRIGQYDSLAADVIKRGLEDLTEKMKAQIKPPS